MSRKHCGVDLRTHPVMLWDEKTDEWVCQTCGDRRAVKRNSRGKAIGHTDASVLNGGRGFPA
jgi:DNA-directed RNA polymerase subunit RPC12/RpoP